MYRLPVRAASEERGDASRIETLPEQVSVHASEDRRVAQRHAAAQAAIERLLEQCCFINVCEHLGNRFPGDIPRNAERLDLPDDAGPAAMPEANLRPCAGQGGPAVVKSALAPQACHRGVDVIWLELAPREPIANLGLRKFAAGEKGETGDIRPLGAARHQCATLPIV